MKYILLSLLFIAAFSVRAQKFEITGKILDADDGTPLESATIYVQKVTDSSLVTYTISEKSGNFTLIGSTTDEKLNLFVSYNGYQPFRRQIDIKNKSDFVLGDVKLNVADNSLGEITLTGDRPPVVVKQDTLEFNAASFNTRQDANLEELMKKLPGVEVDTQGNITVNGKPVSRILVNGKEFFGNDPKIATKNLPKEIIDKIQVTDTKTKSEEFTGKAGNPDDKTINITIQKDKNKGYFARATAGGGTNDRYELSGIGNYFKDKLRVSVLASSNNINSSGFSFDEVFDMMGRNARSISFNSNGSFGINGNNFGANDGITKAETAGINFVDGWGKKVDVTADYFYGRNNTDTRTEIKRENILPNARFYYNSNSSSNLINDSNRANVRVEITPDTLTRISIAPQFNTNSGNSHRYKSAESLNEAGETINSTTTSDNEKLVSKNFSNRLDAIRKFGSRGAYLELNFDNTNKSQANDDYFYSESQLATNTTIQDQYINEDQSNDEYTLGVTQRFVLREKLFLDASYDFTTTSSRNSRLVYDKDPNGGMYTTLNNELSNDFRVRSQKNIPNVGINYEGESWRIGSEIGLLNTTLKNDNLLNDISFNNTYNNLFLRADVRYSIERSKSVFLSYRSDAGIPDIQQLQPVEIRTDPLNIIIGNPDLRPTYSQTFRGGYRNFDFASHSGFFSYGSVTFTNDNVVPVTTVDQNLVRTTTYTNVNGAVNSNLGLTYTKSLKKEEREFRYRLGMNANYDKNIGFTNGVLYNAKRFTASPGISFSWAKTDVFSIDPGYQLTYNSVNYDINPDRNENFINHRISLETTTYWPKNVVWGNDISYNYYGNVSPGFDNTSLLWNMSLGYQFLKDNATLKVKVYDLLDQNVSTRRTVGDDYIQDTNSLILKRYVMLSFTYKIKNFGGQDPNDRGGRRFMRH